MMQKYRLERVIQYTERTEVEAENWDDAIRQLKSADTEFDRMHDDQIIDDSAEYLGEG